MRGHTPGPWVADFHHERQVGGRFNVLVLGGNRVDPIAAVAAGVEGHGRDEGRANARLIKAAPTMLWMLERIRDDRSFRTNDNALWQDLLATIASATGEGK